MINKTISKLVSVTLLSTTLVIGNPSFATVKIDSTTSEASSFYVGISVFAVSAMPFLLPVASVKSMADSDSSKKEEKDDRYITVKALDEAGKPTLLHLPKEVEGKIDIKPTDRVKLEKGTEDEHILYVNGDAQMLFVDSKDQHILQHQKL